MFGIGISAIAAIASEAIPAIAGWFGGDDAEDTAKEVVKCAKKITGLDDDKDALEALKENPQYAMEVQHLMMEWRVKKLDTLVSLYETDAKDRANARANENRHKTTTSVLAFMVVGAFVIVVAWLVYKGIPVVPDMDRDVMIGILGTVLGYLSAKADQVISYFFGSSSGSMAKTLLAADKKKV